MIDLNDDNDPMLFAITVPQGKLIVQYMEILTVVQAACGGKEPTTADIIAAIRSCARTADVAAAAPDHVLLAAWARMSTAVQNAGNG